MNWTDYIWPGYFFGVGIPLFIINGIMFFSIVRKISKAAKEDRVKFSLWNNRSEMTRLFFWPNEFIKPDDTQRVVGFKKQLINHARKFFKYGIYFIIFGVIIGVASVFLEIYFPLK